MTNEKTIKVPSHRLALCAVKAEFASRMSRDETAALMAWCDCQQEAYWENLTLQEILNVYRVSAEYTTFEGWLDDNRSAAIRGYNRAVNPSVMWRE